jgi:hypothetical protein
VRTATLSRHRARAAFKMLTSAGALYAIALDIRAGVLARLPALGEGTDLLPTEPARALDEVLTHLEQRQLGRVDHYVAELGVDATLAESARRDYLELASNYKAMKDLYTHPTQPAGRYASRAAQLKGEHLRLILALQKELGFSVPREHWRPSRRDRRPTRRRMPWPRSCRVMHGRGCARSTSCPPAGAHGATVRLQRAGRLQPRPGGPGKSPSHAAGAPGAHGGAKAGPPAATRPLTRDEPISFVRGSRRITAARRIPASPSRPATHRDRTETLGRTASRHADERLVRRKHRPRLIYSRPR